MSTDELLTLIALATAMSFTPGPNTLLAASLGANAGLRGAWRFAAAVPVGFAFVMLVSGLGVGALVLAWPPLLWGVKGLGVAYLLWLAAKLWRSALPGPGLDRGPGLEVGFLQGVGLQFVNVKAWMMALTLAAGWASHTAQPFGRVLIVCGVTALFTLASTLSYAALGSLLKRWLQEEGRRLRVFNQTMAVVLVATAVWMGFA